MIILRVLLTMLIVNIENIGLIPTLIKAVGFMYMYLFSLTVVCYFITRDDG